MKINPLSQLILASRSPRRVELLKQIGFDCIIVPADIDESSRINEAASDYVMRLAREKAVTVRQNLQQTNSDLPVLAADTTVAYQDEILGKPDTDIEAMTMLKKLSATRHEVHTAVALNFQGNTEVLLNTTLVEFIPLTDAMIESYIVSGEHRDKAGSYAIQGKAGAWIKHIAGSYSGVMGLPLYETAQLINAIHKF